VFPHDAFGVVAGAFLEGMSIFFIVLS